MPAVPRRPSTSELFAGGVGQGLGQGVSSGITGMLNEMLETRKATRAYNKALENIKPALEQMGVPESMAPLAIYDQKSFMDYLNNRPAPGGSENRFDFSGRSTAGGFPTSNYQPPPSPSPTQQLTAQQKALPFLLPELQQAQEVQRAVEEPQEPTMAQPGAVKEGPAGPGTALMPNIPPAPSLDELNRRWQMAPNRKAQEQLISDFKAAQAAHREGVNSYNQALKTQASIEKNRYEMEKAPREYLEGLTHQYESTLRKKPIFKNIESLAGKIGPGSVYKKYLADRWNLPVGMVFDDVGQVVDKLNAQLGQGVSGDYQQTKILQVQMDTYLKTNPSLLNTPEGMQKLARISMALDDIVEKKWKAGQDIRKEARKKGEALPEDLADQVVGKEQEYVIETADKIRDIMSVKGVQPTFNQGQMINKNEIMDLPIGSKVKKGEKIYQRTPIGIEEVK